MTCEEARDEVLGEGENLVTYSVRRQDALSPALEHVLTCASGGCRFLSLLYCNYVARLQEERGEGCSEE